MIDYVVYDTEFNDYIRFQSLTDAKEYVKMQVDGGSDPEYFIIYKRERIDVLES